MKKRLIIVGKGEITIAEANRIGDNMPEGWNFEFEEEDD
jgi:hypothetical protein